jgi:hypothetical protein
MREIARENIWVLKALQRTKYIALFIQICKFRIYDLKKCGIPPLGTFI